MKEINHHNKMTNTFSKMEDTPMRFEIKEGVMDCMTIKVSCSDADGNVFKEELTICTNNLPKELHTYSFSS